MRTTRRGFLCMLGAVFAGPVVTPVQVAAAAEPGVPVLVALDGGLGIDQTVVSTVLVWGRKGFVADVTKVDNMRQFRELFGTAVDADASGG